MYNVALVEPKFVIYLKARGVSSHSIRNYLSDVRHFFGWLTNHNQYTAYASNSSLDTITSLTLHEYTRYHQLNSLPVATINRRLSSLRNFFEFSRKTGAISDISILHVKNIAASNDVSNQTDSIKPPVNHTIITKDAVKTDQNNFITNGTYSLKPIILSILIAFLSTIIVLNLRKSKENVTVSKMQPSALGNRYIAFSGKLTDSLGNPIDTKSDIVFRLYNNLNGGKILYTVSCIGQNYAITPDVKGNFKTLLGKDCGSVELPSSIFIENPEIYVGLSVNSDTEMSPRQPIANVGFAANSNTIQGLALGTNTSAVPFIDQTGTLLISAPSPLLKATSGKFSITAEALTLSTAVGSSGNIEIEPDFGGNTLITSGSLGIGVGLPSSSLDIAGSASLSGNLSFRGVFSQINQLEGGTISFQTSKGGDRELTPRMTILNGGNIGIGTNLPKWKFHVSDTKPLDGIVSIENTSINNTSSPTGLLIKMGEDGSNANPGSNDKYISFMRGDSGVVGKIQGNGSGGITYSTTGSDFAEYFKFDERSNLNEGDVVKIVADTGQINKSEKPYESQLIGVVSSHPGFAGGEPGSNKILVGLIGQVPVKISNLSKNIRAGDFLTSSSEPGKAMRAENKGITLGKALENWDPSQSKDKILVYVSTSWYDPTYTYRGKFEEDREGVFPRLTENISALTATIHNLTTNFITAREKIVSPVIETDTLSSKTVIVEKIQPKDKYVTIDLSTIPQEEASTIDDKGPLARLIIKGLNGKTAASIDASGNASFSGQIVADSISIRNDATIAGTLTAYEASLSGKLVAKEIEAENINSIQDSISSNLQKTEQLRTENTILTTNVNDIQRHLAEIKNQPLSNPSYYQKLDKELTLQQFNKVSMEQLLVSGSSNLYNLNVSNSLSTGQLLIESNSILSLALDLKLSALSTINFFEDSVVISKDGTITTKGKFIAEGGIKTTEIKSLNEIDPVSIKQLAIDNLIITNKFNPSSSSLIASADNFTKNGISSPAIETETQAAGSGFIPGGSPEVIIYNNTIKEDSLIYLTPVNSSPIANLTIVKKETSTSKPYFKVALDKLAEIPVHFNWLIIN